MDIAIIAFGYDANDTAIAAKFADDTYEGQLSSVSYWITLNDLQESLLCN